MELASQFKICLLSGDGEETMACSSGQTLLAALTGRRVRVGCRGGGCGVCEVRIVSGKARYAPMSARHIDKDKRSRGNVLACRTYPLGDLIVELIEHAANIDE